jgi:hypothetical protein
METRPFLTTDLHHRVPSKVAMARRTPQEKKKLSLQKDRRNTYGEPPHGARKSIPLHKRLRNRANRHQQDLKLHVAPKQLDEGEADEIESSTRSKAPKRWRKVPDAPLGRIVAAKHERRLSSHGRKIRWKARIAFQDGLFCGECPRCGFDVYILTGRAAKSMARFAPLVRGCRIPRSTK